MEPIRNINREREHSTFAKSLGDLTGAFGLLFETTRVRRRVHRTGLEDRPFLFQQKTHSVNREREMSTFTKAFGDLTGAFGKLFEPTWVRKKVISSRRT
jgi:hypothetical protein